MKHGCKLTKNPIQTQLQKPLLRLNQANCSPDNDVFQKLQLSVSKNSTLFQRQPKQRARAVHPNQTDCQTENYSQAGTSANAGPHYQKLYARVTHIWGNRKGQPDRSAMKGPHLERTASLITVPPASGKFFVFKANGRAPSGECNARQTFQTNMSP